MLLNHRYQYQKVLGQGGMGKVYLVLDIQTQKQVAIKECCIGTQSDVSSVERIKREFYFMNTINHPNIVKAYDFFFAKGNYYIVMEYVKGITLLQFIRQFPRSIEMHKQLVIAKQICNAVSALNDVGIIHRDIKPANIILQGSELIPKLLDLGLAKSINKELVRITKTKNMVGTPDYMSPEQINTEIGVQKNTDVFPLAVVLYQFFTWQKYSPFYAGSVIATMDKVVNLKLPLLHEVLNTEDKQVVYISQVIKRALKKNPHNRLSSAAKLQQLLSEKPTLVNVTSRTTRINSQRSTKPLKINRKAILCMLLGMAIFVVCYAMNFTFLNTENVVETTNILRSTPHPKENVPASKPTSAQAYNEVANNLAQKSLYPQALKYYDKAIQEDPNFHKPYIGKAKIFLSQGEYIVAEKNLLKSIQLAPKDSLNYINLGLVYIRQGKWQLAQQKFEQVLMIDPRHPKAYANLGLIAFKHRQINAAEMYYNKAIEIDPNYSNAHLNLGLLYYNTQKLALSEKHYKLAIKTDAKNPKAHANLASIYSEKQQYELAEKHYNEAISIHPRYGGAYRNRGLMFYRQKKYDLAEKDYTKSIWLKNTNAYMDRAQLYEDQKKYDLAKKDYSQMIQSTPNFSEAYVRRGSLYAKENNKKAAISDWQKALLLGASYKRVFPLIQQARKK